MGGLSSKPTEIPLGDTIYTIQRVVGKGAFGKVHVLMDQKTGNMLAMKVLEKKMILNKGENTLASALKERQFLSSISHPYIVNLKCTLQNEEELLMILDFMGGGDLQYQLKENKSFTEEGIKFYGWCLFEALRYLHTRDPPLIHRDIKPENIMLDDKGYPHLTDFNVACELLPDHNPSSVTGTFNYMAPEIFIGNYGVEVDIWGVGIVLYQLFRGKTPWSVPATDKETKKIAELPEVPKLAKYENSHKDVMQRIRLGKVDLSYFKTKAPELYSLLKKLLVPKEKRITAAQALKHPFFSTIDREKILAFEVDPPFVPDTTRANVDGNLTLVEAFAEEEYSKHISSKLQHKFAEWDWVPDEYKVTDTAAVALPEGTNRKRGFFNKRGSKSRSRSASKLSRDGTDEKLGSSPAL